MDARAVVSKLHEIDPGFREVCQALYPGLNPAEVYDSVYKSEPSSSDTHVPTTVWRNGRGDTRGRGRRKIDVDVKRTVHKVDRKKLEHGIGLGTTAVGTGISAVALPKHLKELPGAMRQARTSTQPLGAGVKDAVRAVRRYSSAPKVGSTALGGAQSTPRGIRAAGGALKEGMSVARRNPRISAGLVLGATALHTANLGGEAIATHVLAGSKPKKPKQPGMPGLAKAWEQAQTLIIQAHQEGRITKADAMSLAQRTYAELNKASFGGPGALTSGNIKLATLKAPSPVKADTPHLTPNSINQPKPAKSQSGKSGHTSNKGSVKKDNEAYSESRHATHDIEITTEIAKVDPDKQQCFGWASVTSMNGKPIVDKQGDIIDVAEIEKAAYDYVQSSRAGGVMHKRADDGGVHKVADLIESFVVTPEKRAALNLPDTVHDGWFVGFQVTDDEVWKQVKDGSMTGFSIHGSGKRTPELVMDA